MLLSAQGLARTCCYDESNTLPVMQVLSREKAGQAESAAVVSGEVSLDQASSASPSSLTQELARQQDSA
jgi:hypothetical protein